MKQGRPKTGTGAGFHSEAQENKVSESEAAQKLDVSERSVRSAKKVKRDAPELVDAVKQGDIDVKTAARASKLPTKERKKIAKAADPKKAAEKALKEAEPPEPRPVILSIAPPDAVDEEGVEFVDAVEALCRETDQIAARMKALKSSRFSYSMHVDSAVAQVEAARKTLWQGRPAHVCPYCKGEPDGCNPCKNTGRVKKTTFDSGRAAVGEAA